MPYFFGLPEKAFTKSSESSGRVTLALNYLTGVLVLVGITQVFVTYIPHSAPEFRNNLIKKNFGVYLTK
jgi:hypothetical protein